MTDLELVRAFCTHICAVEDGWLQHVGHVPPNVRAVLNLYKDVVTRLNQRAVYDERPFALGQDWVSRVTNAPDEQEPPHTPNRP